VISEEDKIDQLDSIDAGTLAQITELILKMGAELADNLADNLARQIAEGLDRSNLSQRLKDLANRQAPPPEPACAENSASATDLPQGNAGAVASKADTTTCSEDDCDQPARARGLCSKHYQRLRYAEKRAVEQGEEIPKTLAEARANRSRKPLRKTDKRGGGLCSSEGCERPNYAKGLCGKHFMEWVRSKKTE
jgi:hypothetical protein